MKIIVCIKQVPDTTEIKINPETGTLIRDGVLSIMNPDDKSGLEIALELKEKHNGHITVITMGPSQADAILREALAMGVDRAILLTDKKFAGADTLATSHALSAALSKIEYDVIITGRQAIDGDTAQVGPQVAEMLDLPQISYLEDVIVKGKILEVKRQTEEGYETLEVEMPALLTVLSSARKARYMHVRGIMEAFKKEVEVWGFDQISADEKTLGLSGSPTRVAKAFAKTAKGKGVTLELSPEEAADKIIETLKEKFII